MNSSQSLFGGAPAWLSLVRSGVVPFFSMTHMENGNHFQQIDDIPTIVLDNGRVLFDRFTITSTQLSQDSVSWAHQSDRGYTSGHLTFAKSGTELHGFVCTGDDAETALSAHVFATAIPLSEYRTMWGDDGQEGPTLRIGICPGEGFVSHISIFLDSVKLDDVICQSLESTTGHPVLDFALPNMVDTTHRSRFAHIVFDIGQNGDVTFTGTITETVNGCLGDEVHVIPWQGKSQCLKNTPMEADISPLAFVNAALPVGENALSEAEIESLEVQQAILTLLGQVPNDNEVSTASSQYMIENMKYAMWKDPADDDVTSRRKWMGNYFKEEIPQITDQKRIATVMSAGNWYRTTMSTAIFGNALASQNFDSKVVPRPINSAQRTTLRNYTESCLGIDATYVTQQQAVWRSVYLDRAPGLKKYVEEDQRKLAARLLNAPIPTDWTSMTWAERLLEYATSPKEFQIIAENLSGGPMTDPANMSDTDKNIAKVQADIEKANNDIQTKEERLKDLRNRQASEDTTEMIGLYESTIKAQKEVISTLTGVLQNLNEQKADRIKRATLTMRNISSLLFALDSSGVLSKAYMDGVGTVFITNLVQNVEINKIDDYAKTLTNYITTFLNDVAARRVSAFISIDESNDFNRLLAAEALDTNRLAALMVQSLINARGDSFLEKAEAGAATFSSKYPKLTGLFRIGLVAGYVFTVLKVLQVVQNGTGDSSTEDQVSTYGTFSFLLIETVQSLFPNVKNLLTLGGEAVEDTSIIRGVGNLFRSIYRSIARVIVRIITPLRALGARVIAGAVSTRVFSAIRSFFTCITESVSQFAGAVRGRVAGIMERIAASPRLATLTSWVGRGVSFVLKGAMVLSSIWITVTEGINLCRVLKDGDANWVKKTLVSIEFIAIAASSIAAIVSVFSASVVWSGAGAILALVSLGLGLLVNALWPEESIIQKVISQVVIPFIDGVAANAIKAAEQVRSDATQKSVFQSILAVS